MTTDPPTPRAKPLELLVRARRQSAKTAHRIRRGGPIELVRNALQFDVSHLDDPIITWDGAARTELCLLDLDVPLGGHGVPKGADLARYFPACFPRPLVACVSKSGGLHALFVRHGDESAFDLACAWSVFGVPAGLQNWRAEFKTDMRHPLATPENLELRSGPLHWFVPSSALSISSARSVPVPHDEWLGWLGEHDIQLGRHAAKHCPLPNCADRRPTSGSDPVEVNAHGMKCYRCDKFVPASALVRGNSRGEDTLLDAAAENYVNVEHAVAMVAALYPRASSQAAQHAWGVLVRSRHPPGAKRDELALKRATTTGQFPVIRGPGGRWHDSRTFDVVPLSKSTIVDAPWAKTSFMIDRGLSASAIPGYKPVLMVSPTFVRSPLLDESSPVLRVRRPGAYGGAHPEELAPPASSDFEKARHRLAVLYPQVDLDFVATLVMAHFVAQPGRFPVPIIAVRGVTGSGKTTSVLMAAHLVGSKATMVRLDKDAKNTAREIGLGLEGGAGFILADEIGRGVPSDESFGVLLRATSEHAFDAKFRNEVTIPITAPFVLASSTLPEEYVDSPELSRRAVAFDLPYKPEHPNLANLPPIEAVRTHTSSRDAAATFVAGLRNRIATRPHWKAWREFALDEFGAGTLEAFHRQDEGDISTVALAKLYEAYRARASSEDTWASATAVSESTLSALGLLDGSNTERKQTLAKINSRSIGAQIGLPSPFDVRLCVNTRGGRGLRFAFIQKHVKNGCGARRDDWPSANTAAPAVSSKAGDARPMASSRQVVEPETMNTHASTAAPSRTLTIVHPLDPLDARKGATALLPSGRALSWASPDLPTELVDFLSRSPAIAVLSPATIDERLRSISRGAILDVGAIARYQNRRLDSDGVFDESTPQTSLEREIVEARGERAPRAETARRVCARIVELIDMLGPMPEMARTELTTHREINEYGLAVDVAFIDAALEIAGRGPFELLALAKAPVEALESSRNVVAALMPSNPNVRVEDLPQIAKGNPRSRDTLIAQAYLLKWGGHVMRYTRIREHADSDGRVRESFVFAGAGTGRWSSTRANPQGLQRSDSSPVDKIKTTVLARRIQPLLDLSVSLGFPIAELLSRSIRASVVPRPGTVFFRADYAQIEMRVIAWLANEVAVLDAMRGGRDIYRDLALRVFSKLPGDAATDDERAIAKRTMLATLYGAGPSRLKDILSTSASIVDPTQLPDLVMNAIPECARFRQALLNAALAACEVPDKEHIVGRLKLTFAHEDSRLGITLPSGRTLYLDEPHTNEEGEHTYELQGRAKKLHAGGLLQNVVQAIARDVLAQALVRMEEASAAVVFHCHDEVLVEVADNESGRAFSEILRELMTAPPDWAPELPLEISWLLVATYR